MTVKELKNHAMYYFDCNMQKRRLVKEIEGTDYFDEWGCAYISISDDIGVEYNLCIDNTTNENIDCSAIYKTDFNEEDNCIYTDTSTYVSYEVDFNNPKWKSKLENAMCKALIEFFEL